MFAFEMKTLTFKQFTFIYLKMDAFHCYYCYYLIFVHIFEIFSIRCGSLCITKITCISISTYFAAWNISLRMCLATVYFFFLAPLWHINDRYACGSIGITPSVYPWEWDEKKKTKRKYNIKWKQRKKNKKERKNKKKNVDIYQILADHFKIYNGVLFTLCKWDRRKRGGEWLRAINSCFWYLASCWLKCFNTVSIFKIRISPIHGTIWLMNAAYWIILFKAINLVWLTFTRARNKKHPFRPNGKIFGGSAFDR